ncbi:hypothetical protein H0H87_002336 [Tephrocybe sp. NHM501043]|nr:hypothetical protein H0H87_002336 [Tephrocybe sp. NHM501043]
MANLLRRVMLKLVGENDILTLAVRQDGVQFKRAPTPIVSLGHPDKAHLDVDWETLDPANSFAPIRLKNPGTPSMPSTSSTCKIRITVVQKGKADCWSIIANPDEDSVVVEFGNLIQYKWCYAERMCHNLCFSFA